MQPVVRVLCLASAVGAFQPPAARSQQLTQMYGFDNPASRPKRDLSVQPSNGTQLERSVVRFLTLCAAASSTRPHNTTPSIRLVVAAATNMNRTHTVDRRSNKDAYKPALGSRVDDTLSTIPQKGPSLDMGSAKMVGFYGVLAAAVAAALAYQG